MGKCKMCYLDGENIFCKMDDKSVEFEKYNEYCLSGDLQRCPVYKYY